MKIIGSLKELDCDFLAEVLGYAIESFRIIPIASFNSASARVKLVYRGEKPKDAPESIFIKLKKEGEGAQEYRFYQQEKGAYFPHCYGNAYDSETGASQLILEDLVRAITRQ